MARTGRRGTGGALALRSTQDHRKNMNLRHKSAAAVGVAMLATLFVSAAATPASAAGPCGSGYNLVGTYSISLHGMKYGTLEVRWNGSTGKNCALAYGTGSNYGRSALKSARIKVAGADNWADSEVGTYKYYAGPVYVAARGECITVFGSIKGDSKLATTRKENVHCD
ncbi:hypothetical protein GCM10022224_051250 [Nonomuraea antimicrobica]|uniref:Spore-associated protein A n=2 Tax=Nonomuraea antimicrobica TaxID=561173 RepID=A0ABP7C5Q1_9ACTN